MDDEHFMRLALGQAELAFVTGEVPVGAVLVRDGKVIAQAHNASVAQHDPSAHAEMQVLRQAAADQATRAGAVVDDDLLLVLIAQRHSERARDKVGGSARRQRHDHTNRARGIDFGGVGNVGNVGGGDARDHLRQQAHFGGGPGQYGVNQRHADERDKQHRVHDDWRTEQDRFVDVEEARHYAHFADSTQMCDAAAQRRVCGLATLDLQRRERQSDLIEHLYPHEAERDPNTIEVYVARLRRKLGRDAIKTLRGLGYRFG